MGTRSGAWRCLASDPPVSSRDHHFTIHRNAARRSRPSSNRGNRNPGGVPKAAADPKLFPEYGKPWQAKKLFLNQQPNANEQPMGLEINVGEFDPALGRSYNEIAVEGRSMDRLPQAQGGPQERGPRATRIQLVQKTVDVSENAPLFAGVIYNLRDLGQLDNTVRIRCCRSGAEDRGDPAESESCAASGYCTRPCGGIEATSKDPEQNEKRTGAVSPAEEGTGFSGSASPCGGIGCRRNRIGRYSLFQVRSSTLLSASLTEGRLIFQTRA